MTPDEQVRRVRSGAEAIDREQHIGLPLKRQQTAGPSRGRQRVGTAIALLILLAISAFFFSGLLAATLVLVVNQFLVWLQMRFPQPNVIDLSVLPAGAVLVSAYFSVLSALPIIFIGPFLELAAMWTMNRRYWLLVAKLLAGSLVATAVPETFGWLFVALVAGAAAEFGAMRALQQSIGINMPTAQLFTSLAFSAVIVLLVTLLVNPRVRIVVTT